MKSIEKIVSELKEVIKNSFDKLEKDKRKIKEYHKIQKKYDKVFNKKWKKDPPDEF